MFKDRKEAGEKLGEELRSRGIEADLVLAIPRGGLPLGRKVADILDAELDVIVASKIGAPGNPELALGAVASDGSTFLNDDMIERLGVSQGYLDRQIEEEAENAGQKLEFMREEEPEFEDKKIVVVDDGIATGATAKACLRQLKNLGAEKIIFAAPVGPEGIEEELKKEADEVVILETPPSFGSVGLYYENFDQVTDEEAKAYLEK
jgi:putative phosphoribosyl transferase